MYQNGIGTCEIADYFACHRTSIQRILKSNGVNLRKKSPTKNQYNVLFFDNFNPESCYWAGFIAADGHVRHNRASVDIHLSKNDLLHLEKCKNATGFSGNIECSEKKSCRITFSGKWFVDDLYRNFNITSRKSMSLDFPTQIPDKFLHHFIRGVVDGDGYLRCGKIPRMTITSGGFAFLNNIEQIIRSHVVLKFKKDAYDSQIMKSGNVFVLVFCGNNALAVMDWLYLGSHENVRLERKHKVYWGYKQRNCG